MQYNCKLMDQIIEFSENAKEPSLDMSTENDEEFWAHVRL